jgi:hypothetical protein
VYSDFVQAEKRGPLGTVHDAILGERGKRAGHASFRRGNCALAGPSFSRERGEMFIRCDLLSDLYFAILNNNVVLQDNRCSYVVICFQICTLRY